MEFARNVVRVLQHEQGRAGVTAIDLTLENAQPHDENGLVPGRVGEWNDYPWR